MRKMTRIAMLAVAVLVAMCMALCSCSVGDENGSQTDSTGSSQSGSLSASDSVPADESDFDDSEEPNESEESEERENDKIVLEEVPDADNVRLVDDAVRAYLSAATVAEQIAALPEAKLASDKGALPVRLAWKGDGSVRYTLYLADNENFDNATSYVIPGLLGEIEIYNLMPSTTYYWKVEGDKAGDTSDASSFTTEDLPVRLIYAEGTSNVRDAGGWSAGGTSVNYGKIYRGNQLNGYGNWGDNKLTEEGLKTFKDDLKIRTEIDLRTQNKDDANQTTNYVDATFPYYKCTIGQYTDIFEDSVWNALPNDGNTKSDTMENKNDARRLSYATGNAIRNENAMKRSLKTVFEVLADESNYPVYIHCNAGADRTGTAVFLINGLLGVSEADLIRDYELTSFSKVSGLRYRSEIKDGNFTSIGVMQNDYDNFVAFGALIEAIKVNYGAEGKPLSYAIENFLTGYIGVSHEQIESIKRIMLSDYTPDETEYVDGERQVIEVSKTDNSINLGNVVYTSVESIYLDNVRIDGSLSALKGSDFANYYGERELTVTVNTESGKKTVKVPILIVTKYIYTAEDLNAALKITSERNYGYYELKNDITLNDFSNEAKVAFSGKNGFCGIFEGNGHTLTATLGNHGLFGYVSGGATIRNVNFVVSGGVNEAGKSVIGDYVHNSYIENVSIKVSEGTSGLGTDGKGLVTSISYKGNSTEKLTVSAENAELDSLFGSSDKYAFDGNKFEACVIKAKCVKELARYYANGSYVSVYLEDTLGFGGEIGGVIETTVADIINVSDSNIRLNVDERFLNAEIAEIECNGYRINEYKFENGVLSLFNDRDIFGENFGKTIIKVTFRAVNGISIRAEIGAVVFSNSEEVTLDGTREIFLNRATNAISLGEYADATVYSLFCNGYYFGNDVSSLLISEEFRTNKTIHGDNTLTALVGKNDKFYTLQIPVTLITDEISNVTRFNELMKSEVAEYAIYGYYKLTADIGDSKSEFNNGNDKYWQNVDGLYGFRGTLDGAGHSVTGTVLARGLIGLVGKGAVIKNLTVNAYGYANGRTVLARTIRDAVVENVKINIISGESDSYLTEGGIITSLMSHSTVYRNVEVNSDGKTDTLFGCSYWNYDARKANTFENVKITVKSIGGLLCLRANVAESLYTIDGVEGITVAYVRSYGDANNTAIVGSSAKLTIGAENADITEITSVSLDGREIAGFTFENGVLTITDGFTASDIGAKTLVLKGKAGIKAVTVYLGVTVEVPAEEVALDGEREIVLSNGTEFDLDLGEYTSATVLSATLGGENVGYANGKLTIAEEFRANTQKHGVQKLKVTVQKDGKYYNVIANVLVVTKEISDIDSLTAALTPTEGSSVVYGYYRLAKDLTYGGWYTVGYTAKWSAVQRSNPELGFRGTFDGNGKTITSWFYGDGLFGVVGNGAVIKNLTINNKQYQGGNGNFNTLFGYSMMGATMDKVTINILQGGKADIATNAAGGLLTCLGGYGNTLKNVTINAKGIAIDTLFGTGCWFNYPKDYAPNTFENCFITAKSLVGLACTDNANKVVTPYGGIEGLTVTLILDEITAEGTLEIGKEFAVPGVGLMEITSVMLGDNEFTAYSFANGTFTINADAFGVSEAGVKTFEITGKNADGNTVKQTVTVTAEFKAEEIALGGEREIVLSNGTEFDLDLGEYTSATVLSATLGGEKVGYANGKLVAGDEYKANLRKHGLQTLKVAVEKDGKYYNVIANVLVVTQDITTVEQLKKVSENSFGYFRLANNLSVTGDNVINLPDSGDWINADGQSGFRGTFDGNGKTISGWTRRNGLFGVVGAGAVIKNLTYTLTAYESGGSAFGRSITGATVENVTFDVKLVKDSAAFNKEGGIITTLLSHSTLYKNVTVNAEGQNVDSLFGTSWGKYDGKKANTFENCKLIAKSVGGLINAGNVSNPVVVSAAGIEGLTVTLIPDGITAEGTLEIGKEFAVPGVGLTEITSVMLGDNEFTAYSFANGTFTINADAFGVSEAGVKTFEITGKNADGNTVKQTVTVTAEFKAEEIALGGEREIVLSNGTEFDLDLGEYSSATALSATLCGENATYSNGKLTVTDGFKADLKKHGMQTLKVTVQKDGKYYNVIANVLVVTQDITTFDELKSALKFDENKVKFGYYRLKNDLSGYNWYQSENDVGSGIWKNPNGELGFRGTFDGNNLSIRETFWNTGLFGYIGKGAVIKNITFNMNQYSAGKMLFGYSMIGATVDNVKVNVTKQTNDGITEISPNTLSGLLTCVFSYGNTFNKLVVDAQKTDIDTLFGSCAYYSYPAEYEENKFTACTVKANSLIGLACTNNADKTVTPYSGIKELTVTVAVSA